MLNILIDLVHLSTECFMRTRSCCLELWYTVNHIVQELSFTLRKPYEATSRRESSEVSNVNCCLICISMNPDRCGHACLGRGFRNNLRCAMGSFGAAPPEGGVSPGEGRGKSRS